MDLNIDYHACKLSDTPQNKNSHLFTSDEEFHLKRRNEILQKYPQVLDLYEPDINLVYISVGLVVFQIVSSYYFAKCHWFIFLSCMYWIGGSVAHVLYIAFHSFGHNHAFKQELHNELIAIFTNIAHCIPFSLSFKKYHYDHHIGMGEETDGDLPTQFEIDNFKSPFMKFLYVVQSKMI